MRYLIDRLSENVCDLVQILQSEVIIVIVNWLINKNTKRKIICVKCSSNFNREYYVHCHFAKTC